MVEEGPEGFCTEAALCFLYIGLYLYMVLTAVALSMVLTGHKRRRYTQRKPMSADPDAPLCECGQYKCEKTKGGFRKSAIGAAETRPAPPPRRRLPLRARLTVRLKLDPRSSRKRDL